MTFKTLTIEELKKDYMDRHGFVFNSSNACDNSNCDKVANSILSTGCSDVLPEFVVELSPSSFVFVYPQGCYFQSGRFYNLCKNLTGFTRGLFEVDTLAAYLKER